MRRTGRMPTAWCRSSPTRAGHLAPAVTVMRPGPGIAIPRVLRVGGGGAAADARDRIGQRGRAFWGYSRPPAGNTPEGCSRPAVARFGGFLGRGLRRLWGGEEGVSGEK